MGPRWALCSRRVFVLTATSIIVDVLALILAVAASVTADVQSAEPQTGASRVALASITDPKDKPLVDVSADDFVMARALLRVGASVPGGTVRAIRLDRTPREP